MTYLECWTDGRQELFSRRPWPASRNWSIRCPGRWRPVRSALPPRSTETQQGRFSIVVDAAILDAPLLGEGADQKAAWAELLREVCEAAAGELLARTGRTCRVVRFERGGGSEPGFAGVSAAVRRPRVDDPGARRGARRRSLRASRRCQRTVNRDTSCAGCADEPGPAVAPGVELLLDVELEATLRFGCREMPLGEILELGPGDVVQLDRACQRSRRPDRGRQDRGARRGGAGERQLWPAGDRGGGAAQASGEHTMPLLSDGPSWGRGTSHGCACRVDGAVRLRRNDARESRPGIS